MSDPIPLVSESLRRKLPELEIPIGEHNLAGTAMIDLRVAIAKSAPVERYPNLPWKTLVAILAIEALGKDRVEVLRTAARKAFKAEVPLPTEIELALDHIRNLQPAKEGQGPTKVAGEITIVGFVPSDLTLPGFTELRQALTVGRREKS